MMKNILYALMLLVLIACSDNGEKAPESANEPVPGQVYTAEQLNEKIVALESSLEEPILKAEAEIKVRGDRGNLEGVIQSAKAMEDTIQLKIDELKKLSPVGVGGEDFKLVANRYFEYMKSIYTTYREMAEAKTVDAKTTKARDMEKILNGQPAVMENLQQAQAKYAADNGFVAY